MFRQILPTHLLSKCSSTHLIRLPRHHIISVCYNPTYRNHSTPSTPSGDQQAQAVRLSIDQVLTATAKALRQLGWDHNSAQIQAEIMTAAEICGNNQGLVKMMQPAFMSPSADASEPTIERESHTSAVINGNQCPGMIVASFASELAAHKVQSCVSSSRIENYQLKTMKSTDHETPVISVVSTYNTCTSSGQLGHYVKKMAEQGVIGIAFVNSPEYVAAAPGALPSLGTNPIAIGIPCKTQGQDPHDKSVRTENTPFVFDMATSAIALFGVMLAHAKNQPLPSQVAYGKDGKWTSNPVEALPGGGGAIATFGGHKGMGLSLCVEILAGVLSGGAVLGMVESKKLAKSNGHLFIAIRPDGLVENFDEKVASVLKYIKESGENVRIPGEKSNQTAQERLKEGYISIPVKVWDQIVGLATVS